MVYSKDFERMVDEDVKLKMDKMEFLEMLRRQNYDEETKRVYLLSYCRYLLYKKNK